jgi:transcriptional regulator with XRE-family HTH domain
MTESGPKTRLAASLGDILAGRGLSQASAAARAHISQPYFNQVATGRRRASAGWIETVANALQLDDEERAELHRAAARDHGFRIDLTKP